MGAGGRVSHERLAIDRLRAGLDGMPRATLSYGQGNANKFAITEWSLPVLRHFQFGDLRIETPSRTVVIEVESGGGTGNLVKYWPMLAAGKPAKQFVLVHIFRISSDGDYGSHRRLWEFLVERMREDLDRRGIRWGGDWEARLFTYRAVEDIDPITAEVRRWLA